MTPHPPAAPSDAALAPSAVFVWVGLANLAGASVCCALRHDDPDTALRGLYVAFLVWQGLALWSWHRVTGRQFDAYTLPATALWLFNGGGLALTQLFEPDPYAVFNALRLPVLGDFTDAGVVSAFHLTLCCLTALHLGALLAVSHWHAGSSGGCHTFAATVSPASSLPAGGGRESMAPSALRLLP